LTLSLFGNGQIKKEKDQRILSMEDGRLHLLHNLLVGMEVQDLH